jgi:hypothetical protein
VIPDDAGPAGTVKAGVFPAVEPGKNLIAEAVFDIRFGVALCHQNCSGKASAAGISES